MRVWEEENKSYHFICDQSKIYASEEKQVAFLKACADVFITELGDELFKNQSEQNS